MAKNPRLGFRPSPAARAAAARAAAAANPAQAEVRELRLCGLAAVQARFARDPGSVQRLYYEAALGPRVGPLCKVLAAAKKIYRQVETAELEKIAGSVHHGGIVAVATPAPLRAPSAEDLAAWARAGGTVLVLDRVGNAHNLGALARTAAFFGVSRIVIPEHPAAARPNDAAHRVAEGGLEHVEVFLVADLIAHVKALAAAGFEVVGAATRGGRPELAGSGARRPLALVLGNEEHGVSSMVAAACTRLVTIPGSGAVESLNVSVAGAVLLWELGARRTQ